MRGLQRDAARRHVVVKARVVRQTPGGSLGAHIGYLQRDGVTRDGDPGQAFDVGTDAADTSAFVARAKDDRHHFRFIVSPEDAAELSDIRSYTRDLMQGVQSDLGARLDWVAVDHWNTAHPHVHVVVRGRLDDGRDLVISRDYISHGVRRRAEALADLELGPPSPRERAVALKREVEAERWTRLDRALERMADVDRTVDLRRERTSRAPTDLAPLVERARTLERLGVAEPLGPGQWRLQTGLADRLRVLARNMEVAGRLETASRVRGLIRGPEQWSTADLSTVVVGQVIARGRDDELRQSGFAVIDGLDGRLHHLTLPDATTADPRVGAILRASPPSRGAHPMTVVLSDLDLEGQIKARGATWLDRRLLSPKPTVEAGGFASDVADACEKRIDHLVTEGLAERQGGRTRFASGLLERLQSRELGAAASDLQSRSGLAFRPVAEGDAVSGVYRRRVDLASGRFAMIDDGLGFSLVPWRPSLERDLGRPVSGLVGARGEIDWRPPRTLGR